MNHTGTKEYFLLIAMVLFLFWQSLAASVGILVYFLAKRYKIELHDLFLVAGFLGVCIICLVYYRQNQDLLLFFLESFRTNFIFWKLLWKLDCRLSLYYLIHYEWMYLLSLPCLMGFALYFIDLSLTSPHANAMKQMAYNKMPLESDFDRKKITKTLTKVNENKCDGILLGVSVNTNRPVIMPDYFVNQIVLVLGTTGSGKTITLRRFIQRALQQGYPLIIVDGKPTSENVSYVATLAEKFGRPFFGFNCGNYSNYGPFSQGGFTELKDKIITVKDHWESDYYKTVASDYLQTALEVLIETGQEITLKNVADCLNFQNLTLLLRNHKCDYLAEKVTQLQHYDRNALTGLQAHLNLLKNSELGRFINNKDAFTLKDLIDNKKVGYIALPALRYPDFAKVLGKLVINDVKTAVEACDGTAPIFFIVDEFSVFAGEQVLNLINMGRSKGLHTVIGTQGLADLRKVDCEFESQLLNCVNSIICHRLNHQQSAESIAKWIGTCDSYNLTTQIDLKGSVTLGSARLNKGFIVHPDAIKSGLDTGEAFYQSKILRNCIDKVLIKF